MHALLCVASSSEKERAFIDVTQSSAVDKASVAGKMGVLQKSSHKNNSNTLGNIE